MRLQSVTLLQLLILCFMIPSTTTAPMEECRTGLWGVDCQYQCGWCINDGGCFRKNGTCYDRMCEEDFMGEKCLQRCPIGRFGSGCTKTCPDGCFGGCSAAGCDYESCESGRMGKWCMERCPKNRFGPGCKYWCSSYCMAVNYTLNGSKRRCNPINGTCLYVAYRSCRTMGVMVLGREIQLSANKRCIDNGVRDSGPALIPPRFNGRIDQGRPLYQKNRWKACNRLFGGRSCERIIINQFDQEHDTRRMALFRDLYGAW
ncbi:multiple epidermal growth factor-like domains protein 6 [Pomacea canaliculata]|uniref:multiple epidermal growth factor-like domains protein 6 n=1 Tax=Pomacea canaliculata TaxID=400727 RepID=UPI000D72D522|nr:multiple epidermal growth factor-like domains protein 6 [Pomacea canaliculata]XP_025090059.1 multiple epidermal growth factor-like domains protein 6 [Pomacea canaliculata]